jgi:hypothetical protein
VQTVKLVIATATANVRRDMVSHLSQHLFQRGGEFINAVPHEEPANSRDILSGRESSFCVRFHRPTKSANLEYLPESSRAIGDVA